MSLSDHPKKNEHDRGGAQGSQERGRERGKEHLLVEAPPLNDVESSGSGRRADHPADEGVTRARRQAQVPGDQIPGDRTDEPREDDLEGDRFRVDDSLCNRRGHLERYEGAGKVQNRRGQNGHPRRERASGDARGDRVRRVVEAVREIEEEGNRNDRDERQVHGR